MAYSREVIEETYQAFLVARTVTAAANMVGIPESSVYKWYAKYKWEERLKKDLAKVAEDPFGEGALVAKRFDFTDQQKQTLTQATIDEGICLACIQGKKRPAPGTEDDTKPIMIYENSKIEELGLKPRSFAEATSTLEKCWKARLAILSENTNKKSNGNSIDDEPKENYVEEMKKMAQKALK